MRPPATCAPEDFSTANFLKLRDSLKAALISEGLYDDEARALLNTWEASYFKSPGLRVFFLVPREWTDYYLPLQISLPAHINRVMVGRIELVTPEQRKVLQQLAGLSTNTINSEAAQLSKELSKKFSQNHNGLIPVYSGQEALSAIVSVPASYQLYLDLGRFKNALLLDEAKARPTAGLADFISTYHLNTYQTAGNPRGS